MKVKFNQFKTKSTRNSDSKGSNIMKKNRKLTALLVAACMTIPMAATTFTVPMVASGATDITLSEENSSLQAYQIFKGNYSEGKLGVSDWGYAVANSQNFINALKTNTTFNIGTDGANIFDSINTNDAAAAQQIAEIIGGYESDTAVAIEFARVAAAYIQSDRVAGIKDGSIIKDLEDGYYIFADKENPTSGVWSFGLLKVVGTGSNTNITPKRTKPTVTKQVSSENAGLADQTDAEIGEAVHFKIECTLPALEDNLEYYTAYYLEIEDTLGDAFNTPENIKIKFGSEGEISLPNNVNTDTEINDKEYFYILNGNDITIKMENVKDYAGQNIVLEYDAVLNSTADAGNNAFNNDNQNQINSVKLKYSNKPNVVWTPSSDNTVNMPTDTYTSLSAEDIVKVYTYQLVVNKVDGGENPLQGVTFRLKRNSTNEYVTIDNNNKVTGWSNAEDNTTLLTTDANGQIKIIGLDDNGDANEYTLIEVTPLPGYNTVADLPINIVPTFENQELKTLLPNDTAVADNIADGVANVKIVNKQGAQLPETGGIGTKIFYVLGGTLVIGSGAALVIKKRMGKDEE